MVVVVLLVFVCIKALPTAPARKPVLHKRLGFKINIQVGYTIYIDHDGEKLSIHINIQHCNNTTIIIKPEASFKSNN